MRGFAAALFFFASTYSTPSLAFCIAGMGPSCLPNETAALQYINARLATYEEPLFPIVSSIFIDRHSHTDDRYLTQIDTRPGARAERDAKKAASDHSLVVLGQMAEAISRGEPCGPIMQDQIMTILRNTILMELRAFGYNSAKNINACSMMQFLHRKGILKDIRAERKTTASSPYVYYDFKILASETSDAKSPKKGNGIPVSTLGAAKVLKNYYQEKMGAKVGTVEFSSPVIANEFAVECKRLGQPCGNPGKEVFGSVNFVYRSDGWVIEPGSFRVSRR